MSSSASMPLPALPPEVLVHILSFLPLNERFSTCALVQSGWQAAACAATTSISLDGDDAAAVAQQLATSCTRATSLALKGSADLYPYLQLSFPQLHCLELSGYTMPPLSQPGGIVQGCQHLRDLCLHNCTLHHSKALSALTGLTALTHLELDNVHAAGSPDLRPLGALAGLQELELQVSPRSLRSLHKLLASSSSSSDSSSDSDSSDSSDSRPSSAVLPSLTLLVVKSHTYGSQKLQPDRLSSLRSLDLWGTVVPRWSALAGLEELRMEGILVGNDAEWQAMLAGAQLTRLTRLQLSHMEYERGCMSAATLQQLVVACPNVRVLKLGGQHPLSSNEWNETESVMAHGASLQPLAQLRHMPRLTLYSTDFSAFEELAQLQQLRDLTVGGRVFDLVLLHLTQLTGLTRLRRQHFELGEMDTVALQEDIWPVEFDQQAGPIWQQVLNFAEHNHWSGAVAVGHGRALRGQAEAQLAEAQHTISQQQQQLEEQRQQLEEQQQQLAALRAQLLLLGRRQE